MNRQTKIIIILLAIFAVIIGGALFLNRDVMEAGKAAQKSRTITVTSAGETLCVLNEDTIKALPAETFEATVRSHGMKPESAVYKGVEIHDFLKSAGMEVKGGDRLYFKGADTYLVTIEAKELQEQGHIYIVYEKDGREMQPRAEGGEGPYQVILLSDAFSQRWCKFLSEVEWERAE